MELTQIDVVTMYERGLASCVLYCVAEQPVKLGRWKTADILRGARDIGTYRRGWNTLETYGVLGSFSRKDLVAMIDHLLSLGMLERTLNGTLELTDDGRRYLRGELEIEYYLKGLLNVGTNVSDSAMHLAERLDEFRVRTAQQEGKRSYLVLPGATLMEIACRQPRDLSELSEIRGMGDRKIELYGEGVMALLDDWRKELKGGSKRGKKRKGGRKKGVPRQ